MHIDQQHIDEDYIEDYYQVGIEVLWGQRKIVIPKLSTHLVQSVPSEIRELDLDDFRRALLALQDDATGIAYPDTHRHNTAVTVGGVTLARVIEIINDYVVEFEDGQYAINLVGANSNVADRVIVNQVSVRAANSAGLAVTESGVGAADVAAIDVDGLTLQQALRVLLSVAAGNAQGLEGTSMTFNSVDGLKTRVAATYNSGNRTVTSLDAT